MNRNLTLSAVVMLILMCVGVVGQGTPDGATGVVVKNHIPDTLAAKIAADVPKTTTSTSTRTPVPDVATEDLDTKPAVKEAAKPEKTVSANPVAKKAATSSAKSVSPSRAVGEPVTKVTEQGGRVTISEGSSGKPAKVGVDISRSEFQTAPPADKDKKQAEDETISFEGRIVGIVHRDDDTVQVAIDDGEGEVDATVRPVIGMRIPVKGSKVRVHGHFVGETTLEVDRFERLDGGEKGDDVTPTPRVRRAPTRVPSPPPAPVFW